MTRDEIWQKLLMTESGNRQFDEAGKPIRSKVGAVGVAQIMPKYAPEFAKLAGEKFDPQRLYTDRDYNEKLGRAYFDSLMDRFQNDPVKALAAYNGGPTRVDRLSQRSADWLADMPQESQNYVTKIMGPRRSLLAEVEKINVPKNQLRNIIAARNAGQMSPEDAKAFDDDVASGRLVIPEDLQPQTKAKRAEAKIQVPQGAVDAWNSGAMPQEIRDELQRDLLSGIAVLPKGASLQGLSNIDIGLSGKPKGTKLSEKIVQAYQDGTLSEQDTAAVEAAVRSGRAIMPTTARMRAIDEGLGATLPLRERPRELGTGEQILGAGEAALGATGAALGGVLGGAAGAGGYALNTVLGLPTQDFQSEVEAGAQALSQPFMPRTEAGQRMLEAGLTAAEPVLSAIPPVVPVIGEVGTLTGAAAQQGGQLARQGARAAAQATTQAAKTAGAAVASPMRRAAARVSEAVGRKAPEAAPAGSVGAAGTTKEAQDAALAAQFGFTGKAAPSEGDLTRDMVKQQYEQIKTREASPAGELMRENREAIAKRQADVFDEMIAGQGAEVVGGNYERGEFLANVMTKKAAQKKAEVDQLYKAARAEGSMSQPVEVAALEDVLKQSVSAEGTAPIIKSTRSELQRLLDEGELAGTNRLSVNDMEELRKFIRANQGYEGPNMYYGNKLIGQIDSALNRSGGEAYKAARTAYREYAKEFKTPKIMQKLIGTKRGTDDRITAMEDVYNTVVKRGSADDLRRVLGSFSTAGDDGQQAIREMRSAWLEDWKDQAFSNVGSTATAEGAPTISVAKVKRMVQQMDQGGKLDILFGKTEAQRIRDYADVIAMLQVKRGGAVNSSETASTIAAILESAGMGAAFGIPLPVVTGAKMLKKYRTQQEALREVQNSLNYHQRIMNQGARF